MLCWGQSEFEDLPMPTETNSSLVDLTMAAVMFKN